jgi:uncharacterized protein (TIGR02722 family)
MKFYINKIAIIGFSLILILLSGCGSGSRKVTRMQVDEAADISGRWNDTDSRLTAEAMVRDVLGKPWLVDFQGESERKPVVTVGKISNKSSEHIAVNALVKDIERELINSGQISFVASGKEREEVRNERVDQQSFSSVETAKDMANETAADFMLQGVINSIVDSAEGKKLIIYQVDLELVNVETNAKVWLGNKKIKKFVEQDKYKW